MDNRTRPVGRPAKISRESITQTALEIGLDLVTLKAVAEHLGVDHSSLYRHIKNRDDLVYAAADHAIATLDWELDTDCWRDYVENAAMAVWELYQRYPGLAEAIRKMEGTPPAVIREFSRACFWLHEHGFSVEDAALVMDSVLDMTSDSASTLQNLANTHKEPDDPVVSLQQDWQPEGKTRTLAYQFVIGSMLDSDPKDWWYKKLMLLIDGAQALKNKQNS